MKTSFSTTMKRSFFQNHTHKQEHHTDKNPRRRRIFWNHSRILKDLMFHSDGPTLSSDSRTRLPRKLQPVLSQTSGTVPTVPEDGTGRFLSSMIWNHGDMWGPMSKPSQRRQGRKETTRHWSIPWHEKLMPNQIQKK